MTDSSITSSEYMYCINSMYSSFNNIHKSVSVSILSVFHLYLYLRGFLLLHIANNNFMAYILHPSLEREIPDFLKENVLYCDNLCLVYQNNERHCLILGKDLKFYEFHNKQFIHSLDLSKTCLKQCEQDIAAFKGRKCKWFGFRNDDDEMDTNVPEIVFGKFIHQNFEINKLYLLIRCWNKLVIIYHNLKELQIIAEYENVQSFKIVASTNMKYQCMIKIQFENDTSLCTDFQDNQNEIPINEKNESLQEKDEFKHLIERMHSIEAELQMHEEMTQKQFERLKSKQTFGENILRSTKLYEKPMLARCGDVWTRITCDDILVFGIPLINNCMPPNLTILRNIRPILNICNETSPPKNFIKTQSLNYQFRIYQLQQTFDNLESLESFLQSEDALFEENTWEINKDNKMLPTSFVVLLIKFELSQLIFLENECQLFVRFEVKKELETTKESKTKIFEQHLFIKSFDFKDILKQRSRYEISFKENTLHQDFLSIAMSYFSTSLQIEFHTLNDLNIFEKLLINRFNFNIVHRNSSPDDNNENAKSNTAMDIDNIYHYHCKHFQTDVYYNCKPNCMWYGSLVLRKIYKHVILSGEDTLKTYWNFYTKNEDKILLMFKLLLSELISFNCNVLSIKFSSDCNKESLKVINFQNSMREEIKAFLDLYQKDKDSYIINDELFKSLMKLQLINDLHASEL